MIETAPRNDTAMNLMRMALACLDDVGEMRASVHLQHAIDTLTGADVLETGRHVADDDGAFRAGRRTKGAMIE